MASRSFGSRGDASGFQAGMRMRDGGERKGRPLYRPALATEANAAAKLLKSRSSERWLSGRKRRTRNPVHGSTVTWVRIPLSPPDFPYGRGGSRPFHPPEICSCPVRTDVVSAPQAAKAHNKREKSRVRRVGEAWLQWPRRFSLPTATAIARIP